MKKRIKRALLPAIAVFLLALDLHAQTTPDASELTRLLKDFLAGASRNDASTHERFWSEDLIYTGSSGRRIGKADILSEIRGAQSPKVDELKTNYTAEDIRIHQYGDTAVVAFRLVGNTGEKAKTEVSNYLNTGTFLKRDGRWQAVSWQATRAPRPEGQGKEEVVSAQTALHRALLAADVKTLEAVLEGGFIWTHRDGVQMTRQQLLDQLSSGQLKYSKLQTDDVTVALHGEAAVVRGVSSRQRSSFPGSAGSGDASPFTAFYTLTFVNEGGDWRAVAMHTSWP
jgi:ketosteroid isomerase-like protein